MKSSIPVRFINIALFLCFSFSFLFSQSTSSTLGFYYVSGKEHGMWLALKDAQGKW